MSKSIRTLSNWGLVSLNGSGPYLAGYEVGQGTRCSTPLVEFDPEKGTALTSSGRPYHLIGAPDPGYGLYTATEVWGQYFDIAESTIVALSADAAVAMITANANAPYDRTLEEENALRRTYGIPLSVDDLISQDATSRPDLVIPDPTNEEMQDLTAKALEILDRAPNVPPEPGDEMPDDPDDEPVPGRKL